MFSLQVAGQKAATFFRNKRQIRSDQWAGRRDVNGKGFHRFAGQHDLNGSSLQEGQARDENREVDYTTADQYV
jgi:hypothetical protein